jgi:CBS domain-containing protein
MTGITLFIFGGAAEMSDEPPSPAAEFWMAIAGPASSVAVAGAFLGLSYAGPTLGWPTAAVGVLRWVGWINVILVVFNLIPGFPLDGGRVLRAAIWRIRGDLRSATHTASRVGSGFGAAVMGLGVLRLLFLDPIGGLWLVLIGLFIRWAARSGYRQVLIREMLRGETVERFMNTDPLTVDASLSVEQLVEDYIYEHHYKMYPVIEDGGLAGCVSTRDVKDVPREQWSQKTVGEIARGCSETNSLSANTDAMDAFQQMNRHGVSRMLVVDDGRLRGIVALKDLMKFLSRRLELEGDSDGQQFGRQISAATDQS